MRGDGRRQNDGRGDVAGGPIRRLCAVVEEALFFEDDDEPEDFAPAAVDPGSQPWEAAVARLIELGFPDGSAIAGLRQRL